MTMRGVLIAVISSIAWTGSVQAQTRAADRSGDLASRYVDQVAGIDLDSAIAQALEREPSLRATRTQVDVTRGMRMQAGLRPNPTFSFSQQNEPGGTDSQTRVEVTWPLDLFRRAGRVGVADREIVATQLTVADRERLLAADVRMKYGDVAVAVRELTVLDDLFSVASQQYALVTARVEQGAAPSLERDLLRVELQRLEAERLLRVGTVEHAIIELRRTMGGAADAPLRIRTTLEELVQRDSEGALSRDPSTINPMRPDVEAAHARVHLAEAQIERARRDGRVDVNLFGMYMRMDAGFPQRAFGAGGAPERVRGLFHYVGAGASVTVPLRNANQGAIAAAQAHRAGAAAELEAAQLTAQAEIAAARVRDEHARQAVLVYTSEARSLARQNLTVVGQTYELGRATVFDVLAEQRRYLDVERAFTSVLREAYEARQALKQALGDMR